VTLNLVDGHEYPLAASPGTGRRWAVLLLLAAAGAVLGGRLARRMAQ